MMIMSDILRNSLKIIPLYGLGSSPLMVSVTEIEPIRFLKSECSRVKHVERPDSSVLLGRNKWQRSSKDYIRRK